MKLSHSLNRLAARFIPIEPVNLLKCWIIATNALYIQVDLCLLGIKKITNEPFKGKRLDRVVVNTGWINNFPNMNVLDQSPV